MDDETTLDRACALNTEILMHKHDFALRQAERRRERRKLWLTALHEGQTWEDIQGQCGVAKYTLTKELAKARRENPDLSARLPRNRPNGEHPCREPGCTATFSSAQALSLHQTRRGGHVRKSA